MSVTQERPAAATAQAKSEQDPVKVLYIGGQLRSGSTLLGRLMGEVDGCINVGEVVQIWKAGFDENRLCGCGQPFQECEFWVEVVKDAFGGFSGVNVADVVATKRSLERIRTAPQLMSPFKNAQQRKRLTNYTDTLAALYKSIQKVSGARVVVDGSKSAPYSYILNTMPQLDLRLVHLVRDSRAVAYSNQRTKPEPGVHWKAASTGKVSPVRIALEWNAQNTLMRMLGRSNKHYSFMRYEDVVKQPAETLTKICALLDEPAPNLDFMQGTTVNLHPHHTVTGNPDRFKPTITIRMDTEWKEKMLPRHRSTVTALTYPFLRSYGYTKGS